MLCNSLINSFVEMLSVACHCVDLFLSRRSEVPSTNGKALRSLQLYEKIDGYFSIKNLRAFAQA